MRYFEVYHELGIIKTEIKHFCALGTTLFSLTSKAVTVSPMMSSNTCAVFLLVLAL